MVVGPKMCSFCQRSYHRGVGGQKKSQHLVNAVCEQHLVNVVCERPIIMNKAMLYLVR